MKTLLSKNGLQKTTLLSLLSLLTVYNSSRAQQPTNLTYQIESRYNGYITLAWDIGEDHTSETISKYVLYRTDNLTNSFRFLMEVPFPTNQVRIPKPLSGNNFYVVTAVNKYSLESLPSSNVLVNVPFAPTNIVVQLSTNNGLNININLK